MSVSILFRICWNNPSFVPSLEYLNAMSLHYNIFSSIRFSLCFLSFLPYFNGVWLIWVGGEWVRDCFLLRTVFYPMFHCPLVVHSLNIWRLSPIWKAKDTILRFTKRPGIFLLSYQSNFISPWENTVFVFDQNFMLFVWII